MQKTFTLQLDESAPGSIALITILKRTEAAIDRLDTGLFHVTGDPRAVQSACQHFPGVISLVEETLDEVLA